MFTWIGLIPVLTHDSGQTRWYDPLSCELELHTNPKQRATSLAQGSLELFKLSSRNTCDDEIANVCCDKRIRRSKSIVGEAPDCWVVSRSSSAVRRENTSQPRALPSCVLGNFIHAECSWHTPSRQWLSHTLMCCFMHPRVRLLGRRLTFASAHCSAARWNAQSSNVTGSQTHSVLARYDLFWIC